MSIKFATTALISLFSVAAGLQRGNQLRGNATLGMAKDNTVYVPGTPGAPWTQEEMDAISKTLLNIYSQNRGLFEKMYCELLGDEQYPCRLETFDPWGIDTCDSDRISPAASPPTIKCEDATQYKRMSSGAIPDAPKFLRLVFHDCVKYKEGGGGCDGCLDFFNMFNIKNIDETDDESGKRKADIPFDIVEGDNNNLVATADILEAVYTDVTFGYQKHVLPKSLRDLGKSRSDLWAFSALVAVKFFADRNNIFCQGELNGRHHPYSDLFREELGITFPCAISGLRDLHFYTGRRDCQGGVRPQGATVDRFRDYQTWKHEEHPNPHAGGEETVWWMNDEFGLNGRETIALFGAHSVGNFKPQNTMFRYTWTGRELDNDDMLNNLYYRLMAYKPLYTAKDMVKVAEAKATGKPVPPPSNMSWMLNPRCISPQGGPTQWFAHLHPVGSDSDVAMEEGQIHVAFLNSDVGLFLGFNTTEGGYPIRRSDGGCTNLREEFTNCAHIDMPRENAMEDCKQTLQSGGKALWHIVEEYAEDQEGWYHDFTLAMEKMLTSGYTSDELTFSGVVSLHKSDDTLNGGGNCTKDWCCNGIVKGSVCCAATCGQCGGKGCKERLGGADACCVSNIKDANTECADRHDVACLQPGAGVSTTTTKTTTTAGTTTTTTTTTTATPACSSTWCCTGIRNKVSCCASTCGKCGGAGCKDRPGGADACCTSNIKEAGVTCANNTQEACLKP